MFGRHDRYLDPYRQSHAQHGTGFKVTMWADPLSQRRRFHMIARFGHLRGQRILDAGCSRGDFAAYLIERGIDFAHYVGVDALPQVIEFARKRNLPRCEFHCGDVLHDPALFTLGNPGVICISGTLNTMNDAQVFQFLEAAWRATGRALVFNFLSGRAGPHAVPQRGAIRRFDTMRLLDWALLRTSQVAFRQDYFKHGHDATIMMRKP